MQLLKDKYLCYVKTFTSSENYRFVYSHLNIIIKFFDDKEVNYSNLCAFVLDQKQKNVSNSTINKRIRCLKQMYKFSQIDNLDLIDFKKLKETETTFDCLDTKQVNILVDYIKYSKLSLQNKLILSLFLDSGCRLSELLSINVLNLNLNFNYILLEKTKTSKERYILFTEETKENYMIPYLKTLKKSVLFDIKKSAIRSLFERTKKQLHFSKFHPHMLRHTYATILVNNNTNLEFIRLTLGHTNLKTTQRYLRYNPDKLSMTYKNQYYL